MTPSDLDLMRFHDGELDSERQREVRALLERDAGARARLQAMTAVSLAVRDWYAQQPPEREQMERIVSRVTARRARPVAALAVAFVAAAAAALVLFTRSPRPTESGALVVASGRTRAANTAARDLTVAQLEAPSVPLAPASGGAAIIESVDFGGQSATIFVIDGERGDTPVIWLDDSARVRGRMQPL